MSDLPEPLTPPDCDLRAFRDMPLDVGRFRDSDLVTEENPEAVLAAIMLWGAAWHQVPAASVPDNDRWLAKAAGYGRATDSWARIREGALRGFVRCADGRLYNKTLAEKANAAWDSRLKYEWGKAADRHRKNERELPAAQKTKFIDFEDWKRLRNSDGVPPEFHERSEGTTKCTAGKAAKAAVKLKPETKAIEPNSEHTRNSDGNDIQFQRNEGQIPMENALKGREGKGRDYIDRPSVSSISDADRPEGLLLPVVIDQPDTAQIAFERHDAVRREFVPNARVVDFTPARKRHMAARLKDVGGLGGWDEVLAIIRGSPFLRGDTSRNGFVAVIDWILKPANLLKVREGNYDHDEHHNHQLPGSGGGTARSPRSSVDAVSRAIHALGSGG